jgi:hypothetical protein
MMARAVTLPWTTQRWALPFLCVLATTPEVSEQLHAARDDRQVGASDAQPGSPMAS